MKIEHKKLEWNVKNVKNVEKAELGTNCIESFHTPAIVNKEKNSVTWTQHYQSGLSVEWTSKIK